MEQVSASSVILPIAQQALLFAVRNFPLLHLVQEVAEVPTSQSVNRAVAVMFAKSEMSKN